MEIYILVLLSYLAARSWADGFQSILTQISAGSSECNRDDLLGGFDLKTVPQFKALCNIPVPDTQQSDFLLENNVVPILCMGLMDVSLRLCKSAKNDVSPFPDIFPPTTNNFNKTFVNLSKTNDFSLLDEFCSVTVNKFAIPEAASNVTEFWWKILNKKLSDKKDCSNICHTNDENKVQPLCSYILWSNGVFINNQKNNDVEHAAISMGEEKPTMGEKTEESVNQDEKSILQVVDIDPGNKPTEAVITSDLTHVTDQKPQTPEENKSNLTADNNNVGVGTVEQLNTGDQPAVTGTVRTEANPSVILGKPAKKADIPHGKKHKPKQPATSIPIKSVNTGDNINQEKPIPSSVLTEVKVDNKAIVSSAPHESQDNAQGGVLLAPEPQKQALEPGKVEEGLEDIDFNPDVTPDGGAMDQPMPSDKELQNPDSDEVIENGDGDDVDLNPSEQANIANPVSKKSNQVASKASNTGSMMSVQQEPLEAEKVYGEGEILIEDRFIETEDSHFFTYFLCMAVLTIMAYLAFHNKKKLIALAVEGRRTKGGRRRPNSSHYSKLDCSLEEALVSNTTASVTHVLY